MAPLDEGDTGEVEIPSLVPGPECWRCADRHFGPDSIYRCEKCGLALCAGQLYVNGDGIFPYSHRVDGDGSLCGPASFLGEVAQKTR